MEYRLISSRDCSKIPIEQVLINRGINEKDVWHYLKTTENDILNPSSIMNIENGAKMLMSHISKGDNILVQVDSDCDGYTSAAVLLNYLNFLFPTFVRNNITYIMHEDKKHGIVESVIPAGIKLVIAPDASSNDYEIHKELAAAGIDVLVIDHHEAEKISEYACVINNQLCDYPTKSLSGVGMVYKFCSYIDLLLGNDFANEFVDLVALGLIADMMDLRAFETRQLITKGLMNLRNPFVRGMAQKNDYSISRAGGLNPYSVAFYIAPMVNAITRTGTADEKMLIFESMLDYKAYEQLPSTKRGCKGQLETRIEQALRTCTNVKNRQTKIQEESITTIENIIKAQNLLDNKVLLIQLDAEYATDKNLTGLIANKLVAKYHHPTLILNKKIIHCDGCADVIAWEGSGRGLGENSKIKDFKQFIKSSNLTYLAEGHANAFGCGIMDDNIKAFIEYCNSALDGVDFSAVYNVDFIYNANDIKSEEILNIADWEELWGQDISKPYICIENIQITADKLNLAARGTLQISLSNNVSMIKFGSSEEEYNDLYSEQGCVIIDAIGTCSRNDWNNTAQIKLVDYNIIGRQTYYF